jgi:hypothetical protein
MNKKKPQDVSCGFFVGKNKEYTIIYTNVFYVVIKSSYPPRRSLADDAAVQTNLLVCYRCTIGIIPV